MKSVRRLAPALALALSPIVAGAADRLPTIPPAQYTPAQRQAVEEFKAARNAPLSGPFEPMLYSPEVMTRARAMGDYLRYKSAIGNVLSEFVILVTAREWNQDYEWSVHAPIAAKAGIPAAVIAAISEGRRPENMTLDQTAAYEFSVELIRNRRVSDTTFARAEARFGKPGIVDMAGVVGYYSFLAMELNAAAYRAPDGTVLPR